jgi:hypothetical protein
LNGWVGDLDCEPHTSGPIPKAVSNSADYRSVVATWSLPALRLTDLQPWGAFTVTNREKMLCDSPGEAGTRRWHEKTELEVSTGR